MKTTTEAQTLLEDLTAVINDVATAVGAFRVQLALGEAEAIQAFSAQKKKVADRLNRAENYISNLIPATAENPPVQSEIDQARIKMEILRLHFHFPDMDEEACNNKIKELKSRINVMPANLDVHTHLLSVEEEIKAAHAGSKNNVAQKTK